MKELKEGRSHKDRVPMWLVFGNFPPCLTNKSSIYTWDFDLDLLLCVLLYARLFQASVRLQRWAFQGQRRGTTRTTSTTSPPVSTPRVLLLLLRAPPRFWPPSRPPHIRPNSSSTQVTVETSAGKGPRVK